MFSICSVPSIIIENKDGTNLLNNFEHTFDTEFLEPLFSDFPSVSHNYTSKLNLEWKISFKEVLTEGRVALFSEMSRP